MSKQENAAYDIVRRMPVASGTRVDFSVTAYGIAEAGARMRDLADTVTALGQSLLGERPGCAEDLGIDLDKQAKLRQFHDKASYLEFAEYLSELIRQAKETTENPVPYLHCDEDCFIYSTANGSAVISMERRGSLWYLRGRVLLPSRQIACVVRKKLLKLKITATVEKGL